MVAEDCHAVFIEQQHIIGIHAVAHFHARGTYGHARNGQALAFGALGQQAVRYRNDDEGRRVAMTIPDHVDILCEIEQGGQMRFNVSTVLGHAPANADIWIFGTQGTLNLHEDRTGKMTLHAGQRGGDAMAAVTVDPAKRGGWRLAGPGGFAGSR